MKKERKTERKSLSQDLLWHLGDFTVITKPILIGLSALWARPCGIWLVETARCWRTVNNKSTCFLRYSRETNKHIYTPKRLWTSFKNRCLALYGAVDSWDLMFAFITLPTVSDLDLEDKAQHMKKRWRITEATSSTRFLKKLQWNLKIY